MLLRAVYVTLIALLLLVGYFAWRRYHVQKINVHVGKTMQLILQKTQTRDYDPDKFTDQNYLIWPLMIALVESSILRITIRKAPYDCFRTTSKGSATLGYGV